MVVRVSLTDEEEHAEKDVRDHCEDLIVLCTAGVGATAQTKREQGNREDGTEAASARSL